MPRKARKTSARQGFPLISRKKLLALYGGLLKCRMLEAAAREMAAGRRSLCAEAGHEAAVVAVGIDLLSGDSVAAPVGDFLPDAVRGAPPEAILSTLRSLAEHPRVSMSARINAALDAARSFKRRMRWRRPIGPLLGNIAVVFGNRASISSAAWRDALRIAAAERLPIVFVSQGPANPKVRSQAGARSSPAMPAITVDRDDVVALYRVASEAIGHARCANGPTLIECVPWTLVSADEGAAADNTNCAIANMERYLAQAGIAGATCKARVTANFKRKLGAASAAAKHPEATGQKPRPM